jgi:hypothetical protein
MPDMHNMIAEDHPHYMLLTDLHKDEIWPRFINVNFPANHIREGCAVLIPTPFIGVIASDCSYIRLPDDHPWITADPFMTMCNGGFRMKTIGCAKALKHFPLKTGFNIEVTKWLINQFTSQQIMHLLDADILAAPDKTTPKRWLCLEYSHLNHPVTATSIVKLSLTDRTKDVHSAVAAAQKAYNTSSPSL